MLLDLLLLLLPLIVGYAASARLTPLRTAIDHSVNAAVYIIVFLMGLDLAGIDDLAGQFMRIGAQAGALFCALALFNLIALWLLAWRLNVHRGAERAPLPPASASDTIKALAGSIRLAAIVACGLALGLFLPTLTTYAAKGVEIALYVLLGLIGIQLRLSGMSLRQVLLNRSGLSIAVVVALSSLLAGVSVAPLFGWRITDAMALASGFGWYSLSGIVIGDQLGPLLGSVAFINDLARELFAVLLIPIVIRRMPGVAVGYCGATAMDVTLPVIQRAGGITCVPMALASGFLLSLLSPPLMLLMLSMG
ncbi:lysine exporter LysO family protein [Phytohalomonas tamaricis]|uniref:lysine exporter LysO family protein n=1 Tax=Phytohalomonas tamaricis TaxID=2081032 RepID=UPI000D0B4027|nr:lysine exporter LysO family protein [Phytohalomonas tamaricis]